MSELEPHEDDATTEAAHPAAPTPAPAAASFEVPASVRILEDIRLTVTAELGRTELTIKELLDLRIGSVVELDRSTGTPADLLANGKIVARGEVVVVDEEFAVRISEIVGDQAHL